MEREAPKDEVCPGAAPWVGSRDQPRKLEELASFRLQRSGSMMFVLSDFTIVRAFVSGREGLRVDGIRVRLAVLLEPL